VNIAVHFIRVRSNLIKCSEGFSIYSLFSGKGEARYKGKRERGEKSLEL